MDGMQSVDLQAEQSRQGGGGYFLLCRFVVSLVRRRNGEGKAMESCEEEGGAGFELKGGDGGGSVAGISIEIGRKVV